MMEYEALSHELCELSTKFLQKTEDASKKGESENEFYKFKFSAMYKIL
jgi:hypothetical protein